MPKEVLDLDLMLLIERHFYKVITSVLLCWILGAAYYFFSPNQYESTAEILLEPKDQGAATGSFDSSSTINRTLSDDSMASHLVMIQSSRLINEAIERSGLGEMPSLRDSMSSKHRSPAEYIQDHLTVTRGGSGAGKKANTLKLKFVHSNAEDAKLLLAAILKRFQDFVAEKFVDDKERLMATINQAQSLNQQELNEANAKYRKFRQEVPILWNGRDSTNVPRMLYEEIQNELNALQLKRTEIESRLKVVDSQLERINTEEVADPKKKGVCDIQRMALIDADSAERVNILLQVFAGDAQTAEFQSAQPLRMSAAQTEAAGLLESKQRLQKLLIQYGPQHPEVESLQAQIREMDKFVTDKYEQTSVSPDDSIIEPKTLIESYVRLLRNDLIDIEGKQKELTTQGEKAEQEARALVNYELEGEILRDHVDDLHSLFDATVDKLRDINLAAGYGGLINETLEYAENGKKVWPKLSVIMALSTLLGLCIGGGVSVLYELQNGKLRTAQEIERLASQPVLGQVPSLSCLSNSKYLKLVRESGSEIDRSICTNYDSLSQEAEVFRGLRTVLFFKLAELKTKTFAVTSANAGDGKSTVCGNIAVSIAQSGRKVLVIECDLRKPAVAGLFASENVPGLSEVLSRTARIEDAINGCEVDNLDILSAGDMRTNPAELLASPEFKELVAKVETHYDFVILDCPPVLAVADPCIVAAAAGAMVVVVKLNQFSRVELRRTMEMLNEVQASVVGIVVNNSALEDEGLPGKQNSYMVGYGYGPAGSKAAGYYRSVVSSGNHPTANGSGVAKRL